MVGAPCDEVPARSMPETAQKEDHYQVEIDSRFRDPVSSQRNVEIVTKPRGKRNMPAAPEFLDRLRDVGIIEVFHEFERRTSVRALWPCPNNRRNRSISGCCRRSSRAMPSAYRRRARCPKTSSTNQDAGFATSIFFASPITNRCTPAEMSSSLRTRGKPRSRATSPYRTIGPGNQLGKVGQEQAEIDRDSFRPVFFSYRYRPGRL